MSWIDCRHRFLQKQQKYVPRRQANDGVQIIGPCDVLRVRCGGALVDVDSRWPQAKGARGNGMQSRHEQPPIVAHFSYANRPPQPAHPPPDMIDESVGVRRGDHPEPMASSVRDRRSRGASVLLARASVLLAAPLRPPSSCDPGNRCGYPLPFQSAAPRLDGCQSTAGWIDHSLNFTPFRTHTTRQDRQVTTIHQPWCSPPSSRWSPRSSSCWCWRWRSSSASCSGELDRRTDRHKSRRGDLNTLHPPPQKKTATRRSATRGSRASAHT